MFRSFNPRYKKELKKLIDEPSRQNSDSENARSKGSHQEAKQRAVSSSDEDASEEDETQKRLAKKLKPLQIDDGKSNSSQQHPDSKKNLSKKNAGGRLKKQSSKNSTASTVPEQKLDSPHNQEVHKQRDEQVKLEIEPLAAIPPSTNGHAAKTEHTNTVVTTAGSAPNK